MEAYEGKTYSPEAKIRSTNTGKSLSGCFNQPREPLVVHEILNAICFDANGCWIENAANMSPMYEISRMRYLSNWAGPRHLFGVRTMYPLDYSSYVWPETAAVLRCLLSMLATATIETWSLHFRTSVFCRILFRSPNYVFFMRSCLTWESFYLNTSDWSKQPKWVKY